RPADVDNPDRAIDARLAVHFLHFVGGEVGGSLRRLGDSDRRRNRQRHAHGFHHDPSHDSSSMTQRPSRSAAHSARMRKLVAYYNGMLFNRREFLAASGAIFGARAVSPANCATHVGPAISQPPQPHMPGAPGAASPG